MQSLAHLQYGNMAKIPMWPNANHEKDVVDTLIWNRWLLRVLGVWPLICTDTTKIERILAVFSFALCWIVLSLLLVLTSMYTFSDRSILGEKMKMLGPLGYVFFSMLKYLFLVIRRKSIRRCVRDLSTDWRMVQNDNHREIMIRDAAKGHTLSKFCIMFMYCGGLSYNTVMPFLSRTMPDNEQNVTVRPMAYLGFDILFNLQLMPTYVFAFCLQCFTGIVMFNVTTVVCCLAAMFVAHACGQINIVIDRVENLVKAERRSSVKFERCMAIVVQHHVRALRFSASIEDTLREMCLVELVGTTLIMCLVEYSLITENVCKSTKSFSQEWNNSDSIAIFTYFFLFVSFAFNIFIFCYIGELLTGQCNKIGHTSYKIQWYNLPGKSALDLMLMITMSRQPIQITAGKIVNLSLSSFGNILKTSVAYLNLLRTAV